MKNLTRNVVIIVLGLLLVSGVAFAYNGTSKVVVEGDYIEATGDGMLGGFYSPDIEGIKEMTEAIAKTDTTATSTLRDTDSGTTYYLSASGTEIVLPAVYKGLNFRFVINGASTDGNYIIKSSEGDNMYGVILTGGVDYACSAEDQVNFITDGEVIGDFVELRSDGSNWVIGANGATTDAKITCTDPS
jgi:hypothetical protein